jgi:hypothetical protein
MVSVTRMAPWPPVLACALLSMSVLFIGEVAMST